MGVDGNLVIVLCIISGTIGVLYGYNYAKYGNGHNANQRKHARKLNSNNKPIAIPSQELISEIKVENKPKKSRIPLNNFDDHSNVFEGIICTCIPSSKGFESNQGSFLCFKITKAELCSPGVALTASKKWISIIGDKIIIKNDDFQNYQYSKSSLIYRINLHRDQLSIPSNPINFLNQSISSNINFIDTNSFDYRIFELVMSNIKEEKWADNSIKDARTSILQIEKIKRFSTNNQFLKGNIQSMENAQKAFNNELNTLPKYIDELRDSTRQCLELLSVPSKLRPVVDYDTDALDIQERKKEAHERFENLIVIKQSYDEVNKLIKGTHNDWDLKG